jgi:hypothetical protein
MPAPIAAFHGRAPINTMTKNNMPNKKCVFYWVHVTGDPTHGLLYFTKQEADAELTRQKARSGNPWRISLEVREEEEADFAEYLDSDDEPIPASSLY